MIEDNYYIKQGKKYVRVGTERPSMLSDGFWLVDGDCTKLQRIAKIGELRKKNPFLSMMQHRDILSTYLRGLFAKYINDTIEITDDGGVRYVFPCSQDVASDILKFLSGNREEREKEIVRLFKECDHFDSQGNVINLNGMIQHKKNTKEAIALKIEQLKQEIATLENKLGEKLIEHL